MGMVIPPLPGTPATQDGDPLADLSPRARKLLDRMNEARGECRALHRERAAIEERLMEAMARASQAQAQAAYYACLTADEAAKRAER